MSLVKKFRTRVIALRKEGKTYNEIREELGIKDNRTVQACLETAGLVEHKRRPPREQPENLDEEFLRLKAAGVSRNKIIYQLAIGHKTYDRLRKKHQTEEA